MKTIDKFACAISERSLIFTSSQNVLIKIKFFHNYHSLLFMFIKIDLNWGLLAILQKNDSGVNYMYVDTLQP